MFVDFAPAWEQKSLLPTMLPFSALLKCNNNLLFLSVWRLERKVLDYQSIFFFFLNQIFTGWGKSTVIDPI